MQLSWLDVALIVGGLWILLIVSGFLWFAVGSRGSRMRRRARRKRSDIYPAW